MRARDHAAPLANDGTYDPIRRELAHAFRRRNDVYDGIHRAHLVKMHILKRNCMNLRFRFADDAKNPPG